MGQDPFTEFAGFIVDARREQEVAIVELRRKQEEILKNLARAMEEKEVDAMKTRISKHV